MVKLPRVSVLMTVYNAMPYLREAIESIVNQTFEDWELIVIENGSTDESPNVLASFNESRIRTKFLPENIGRTPALRLAFDEAKGNYIAVLDADDVSHPERLAAQLDYLDNHPEVVLVGTWANYINEGGNVIGRLAPSIDTRELYDSLGGIKTFVHSSVMYRAADAEAVGGYPEEFSYGQDSGLWVKIAQRGEIAMLDKYLCSLRISSQRMSSLRQYQIDAALDSWLLCVYARKCLTMSKLGLRRNRTEMSISRIKYGLALIMSKSFLMGFKHICLGLVGNPWCIFNKRILNLIQNHK